MPTCHVVFAGRVQGVGFRQYCRDQALALGISGWVRNLPEGTVEATIQGDPEAVAQWFARCENGPPFASVTSVRKSTVDSDAISGFAIKF